jgi:3D (Asp-Asp-Asp) domain-containing protein
VSQQALGVDLRTLYKRGDVSTLSVVLGARSLDDAVSELDVLSRAADESRQIIGATSTARARIVRLRRSLAVRKAQLADATAAARSEETALQAAREQRLAFISHLRLEAQQLADLQATANRIEHRSSELQAAATAEPVSLDGRALTVSATGYSLVGRTATGMPVGWGVVAVDPGLIPLGTRLTIPGYGEAVAADTGSGVRGGSIDLWFPTLEQARAWGRRTVTIALH